MRRFKVPIWNLEARAEHQVSAARLHPGGRRHAVERLAQSACRQVNIAIMRLFMHLREALALNKELAHKLAALERRLEGHDQAIKSLFDAIRQLMSPPAKPLREIGFHIKEDSVRYHVKRKRP